MTEHTETRAFNTPIQIEGHWVVEQVDPLTEAVVAEFGYPTESAAWGAYRMLTQPKGDD
jgi:hypothetical protein